MLGYSKMLVDTEKGKKKVDIHIECPLCGRKSHVVIEGNVVDDVIDYMLDSNQRLIQSISLEAPIREFLKSGFCHDCMDQMFGITSNKIKYVKERRLA